MTDVAQLVQHVYIDLDGSPADEALMDAVETVTVETSLHLPDMATIVLRDHELVWIDSEKLKPGVALKISAKGPRDPVPLFDGEIVELEPELSAAASITLLVRAFDRRHRLARGQQTRSFLNHTDSDIFQKLAKEVGLNPQIESTSQVYDYVFQSNETNLNFIQRRAASLGRLVSITGDTLIVRTYKESPPAATLQWGVTLSEFRPRLSTIGQVNEVMVRSWDMQAKREVVGQAKDGQLKPKVGVDQTGGAMAKKAFKLEAKLLLAERSGLTQSQVAILAQATANQRSAHFIEAEGTGSDLRVRAGVAVEIKQVGARFSGTYFVTAATYRYSAAGQSVEFHVSGLAPVTVLSLLFPTQSEPTAPPGLAIGIVTDNTDPLKLGRVKLKFPWLTSDHASDWVRVASIGNGPERGFYWTPEINDEVLVGFEHGDIERPYVLGNLWNGKDKPPIGGAAASGGKVTKRIIRSRTGHEILLDDNDAGGGIIIKDKSGNEIKLDAEGMTVTLTSKGDMTLDATGNLTLKTKGSLAIEATGSGSLKATNLSVDGGPKTDIKGGVVNLN